MGRIAMSLEGPDCLEWLKRARDRKTTQREPAERTGVTQRWVRKLLRRIKKQGDAVVVHRFRRQASNRKLPAKTQKQAVAILRKPDWHDFGPALPPNNWPNIIELSRQGNAARVDDRSRHVAARFAPDSGRAWLAATTQRLRRVSAVGYFRARLGGRSRAGAVSGADDR
jgi:DNA-binding Lrp family transcriptional regulator